MVNNEIFGWEEATPLKRVLGNGKMETVYLKGFHSGTHINPTEASSKTSCYSPIMATSRMGTRRRNTVTFASIHRR